ncbi:putative leucine-rich repeat receptor-like protein kinase [Planoprotostelium fungivorum]|uniref:Putative leucine-rich repeat receptor-like protein kinase n=1 Tax=Planoprotostelium fungivorum TaxID=1890364 RepID=A0A2P6P021_9EUKA|nr:putative leucine-rich repeat receptor-like protein kinase [Planoprotostelium fungivorum]
MSICQTRPSVSGNVFLSHSGAGYRNNRTNMRRLVLTSYLLCLSLVAADQLSALQSFASQLNGNNWKNKWTGSQVYMINVGSNGLSGTLPNNVWTDLSNLQFLNLTGNAISGDVCDSILRCETNTLAVLTFVFPYEVDGVVSHGVVRLIPPQKLYLGNNMLSGNIPDCISQLTQLTDLNVASNNLAGYPGTMQSLVNLQTLYIGSNSLNMPNICTMRKLRVFDMSNNRKKAYISPCNYTGMVINQFFASSAQLGGTIPPTMGDLPLIAFDISFNGVSGAVPSGIFNPNLILLGMQYNKLSGIIPDSLMTCIRLVYLNIGFNFFSSMPSSFANLTSLQYMNLEMNVIKSQFPPDLSSCQKLATVQVQSNRFFGEIPQNLSTIKTLTVFSLLANDLHGDIPSDLGLLPLTYLNLGDNLLTGNIPDSFNNLTSVQTLILSDNSLAGQIPSWLLELPALTTLDLSFNNFSGGLPIPSRNVNIQSLDMSKNKLSGPFSQELSDRLRVSKLTLEFNQLSGELPSFWTGISEIHLAGNDFSGNFPASFVNNTQVTVIDFSNNQLGGQRQLPEVFANLNNLSTLILSGNNFSGKVPEVTTFPYYPKAPLVTLKLDDNSFSGVLPSSMSLLVNLVTLDLSSNQFTYMPAGDLNFNSLQTASFANNQFSGTVEWLKGCLQLRQLDISHNRFSGDLFDNQNINLNMKNLNYLDVSFNAFTAKILWNLPPTLIYFDASSNQFVDGNAPEKVNPDILRSYPALVTCRIANNMLRGYILSIFTRGRFPQLSELDLSGNFLIGPIPPTIGQLSQLKKLSLQDNQLTSEIPKSLGNLVGLTELNLGSNRLYVNDFSFVGKLNQLQLLNLSRNEIGARIPDNINSLTHLETFDISHNSIMGTIPPSMYEMRVLTKFYVNNNHLYGQVSEFAADLNEVDLSSNEFSGDLSLINGLVSVTYLNLSRNSFSGNLPDISQKLKLTTVDLSYNQINGTISPLSALSNLQNFQVQSNLLNGSVPSLTKLHSLTVFNVSNNHLIDNIFSGSLPVNISCDMSGNPFQCPITTQSSSVCSAVCTTTGDDPSVTVRIRVEGQVSNFDQNQFLQSLSQASNTQLDRLSIASITSGSVIVDVKISPAKEGSTDGTAMRRAEIISQLAQPGNSIGSYAVLSPAVINPSTEGQGKADNKALIIGVVLGSVFLIVVIVAISGFLYMRSHRGKGVWENQLSYIDLKSINLGEAKNSIRQTPFNELKHMREVGSGAFGVVYKAEWRSLEVAVKQIRAEHVTQTQLNDFMVALLQRLRPHPNVVLFMAVTFPPDPLSLYCEGGSLLSYMKSKSVSVEQKYKWIYGIALGMYHLHQEKVIHRDLAARNILLSKYLEAKVSDFGLSRETQAIDDAAQTQNNVGPLKWMAPEAMTGRVYSKATDVFSYGVTVWEILTEKEPWTGLNPMEAAMKVIQQKERMPIPSSVETWLANLIRDCWVPEPSRRPLFPSICETLSSILKVDGFDDSRVTQPSASLETSNQTHYAPSNDLATEQYHSAIFPTRTPPPVPNQRPAAGQRPTPGQRPAPIRPTPQQHEPSQYGSVI